jgi:hypothetical protein
MAYLSYADLHTATRQFSINETADVIKARAAAGHVGVFLAHSSDDDEHVGGVTDFFRQFNALVYSDDSDKDLPAHPDTSTARRLSDRIRDCKRFVVLVSPNSRGSKWIPWELGIAHGLKGVAPIAILPITPYGDEAEWTKEQYFGLYPRIRNNGTGWVVHDPRDNRHWELSSWLHDAVN